MLLLLCMDEKYAAFRKAIKNFNSQLTNLTICACTCFSREMRTKLVGRCSLSLSRRKRPVVVVDTEAQKKSRIAGEICLINVVYPSGIANPANNCYANSVLQCLLNHPSFSKLTRDLFEARPHHCSRKCRNRGMYLYYRI